MEERKEKGRLATVDAHTCITVSLENNLAFILREVKAVFTRNK